MTFSPIICVLRGASTILIVGIEDPVEPARAALGRQWIRLHGAELYGM